MVTTLCGIRSVMIFCKAFLLCNPIGKRNLKKKTKQNIVTEWMPHSEYFHKIIPQIFNVLFNVVDVTQKISHGRTFIGSGHGKARNVAWQKEK